MSFVRRTTIILACSWASLVHTPVTSAVENFFVKSATYSNGSAYFQLRASIPANDSANVIITAKNDEAKRIVDGLTTSVPALVSTSTSGEVTSITVTIRTATAVDATISYATCAVGVECEKDILAVHYEVDQANQDVKIAKKNAALNGFARVKDASKSNAKWSGTTLVVQRGANGNFTFKNIDMDVSNTIVLPIPGLSNYPVTLKPLPDTVVLGGATHDVLEITNEGDDVRKETLQKGEVRLLRDGVYWNTTKLDKDLKHGEKAPLIAGVSEKVVSTQGALKQDQWYEALSIDGGKLKYKIWSVQPITLENKTDRQIQVIVDPASDPVNIPARKSLVLDIADTFGSERETDLQVFTEPELTLNTEKLRELRKFSSSVSQNKINTIRFSLDSILRGITLGATRTIVANVINDLTMAGAPGSELDYWREQMQTVEDDLRDADVSIAIAKSTLKRLFEKSTESQLHASAASTLNRFISPLAGSGSAPSVVLTQGR